MSMPNIPDIKPDVDISRDDAINVLLSSIGMEELSLAHILNAEAEKIQFSLGTLEGSKKCPSDMDTILRVNKQSAKTLRDVIKNQMLLSMKLEDIIELLPPLTPTPYPPCKPPYPPCPPYNPCYPYPPYQQYYPYSNDCYKEEQKNDSKKEKADNNYCNDYYNNQQYADDGCDKYRNYPDYADLARQSQEYREKLNNQYNNHTYEQNKKSNNDYPTMQHHTISKEENHNDECNE